MIPDDLIETAARAAAEADMPDPDGWTNPYTTEQARMKRDEAK